eukprot:221045_1
MTPNSSFLIAFAVALSARSAESFSFSFSPPATTTTDVHRRRSAISSSSGGSSSGGGGRCSRLAMSSAEASLPLSRTEEEDDNDDEMEWVEEEFELLTERDFYNTEWKIGTLMDDKPKDPASIDTTWVRLVTNDAGENVAIWGDDSKGKWTIDVATQFFSISKETFGGWFGKRIWAGTVEDFYYLDGTVRGWGPISPASVDGQWKISITWTGP